MKILLTGAAGFIGSEVFSRLASRGDDVVGIDNINDYYDIPLKYARLERLGFQKPFIAGHPVSSDRFPAARFIRMDLCDREALHKLFTAEHFDKVVNLAAQAGVRYSITNPYAYLQSNLDGFMNILEGCRNTGVKHLVFASSSSVYGTNAKVPFSEEDPCDTPVSLYAATKKSNELMAHAYAKLYGFAATGLRYFTVYGPWGRPDMAPMKFARAILNGETIDVYNHGDMLRDFTYIDDIAAGTMKVIDSLPIERNGAAFRVYNIGCSHPVHLMDFIHELEEAAGRKAVMNMLPMQPGDVYQTYADTTRLEQELGYRPGISLHEGIQHFMRWYKEYYGE